MMSYAAGLSNSALGGLVYAPGTLGDHSPDRRHFDARETQPAEQREDELLARLPILVRSAKVAKGWAWLLSGVESRSVTTRDALARLPVLRRHDIAGMQAGKAPFGGLVPEPPAAFKRLFTSPGGVYQAEASGNDSWRAARGLFAAGVRKEDVVLNCLSYHLAPAGFIVDAGCRALGCPVIPAGPGDLDERIEAIEHLLPSVYAGTADYLLALLDRARASGRDVSSLRIAFIPEGGIEDAARARAEAHGISVTEALTTPELGVLAFETPAHDGFVLNEDLLVEIVRPGTGEPVAAGEVGEVVVTAFDPHRPFIRLATGLLSAILPGTSADGHTNTRLAGWLGTARQSSRIGNVEVTAAQMAEVRRRHPGIGRLRLTLSRNGEQDEAHLAAESTDTGEGFAAALADTLRAVAHVDGRVELVVGRRLPNDGRVIVDARSAS